MRASGQLRNVADDLISRVKDVTSPLPQVNTDAEFKALAQAREARQRLFVEDSMVLWQEATQIGLAGLARDLGVLTWETFGTIERGILMREADFVLPPSDWGTSADPYPSGSIVEMAADTIVREIAEAIAGAGLQVGASLANAIPIAGAIIGGILDLGGGVRKALIAQRAADMPKLYKPSVFNPEEDVLVFRTYGGDALRSGNWTDVFYPPGLMQMVGNLPPFAMAVETDGSVSFVPREPSGAGMIPGSINLHAGIDVLPGGGIRELGEFLPTLRKQAMWMWQGFIAQPEEPAIYSIITRYLADAWAGYMLFFRRYIEGEFQYKPTNSMEWPSRGDCRRMFGDRCKGPGDRWAAPFTAADRTKLIDFLAKPGYFGWAREDGTFIDSRGRVVGEAHPDDPYGIHRDGVGPDPDTGALGNPYQAAQWLRERQFRTLDTLSGAYVDRSYAAIDKDADPALYEHFELRRGQLLQSGARCLVDLDNVPTDDDGGIWYEQLERSGVGSVGCGGGRLVAELPDLPVIPAAPQPAGMDETGRRLAAVVGKRRRRGGGGFAVAAAVAVGLMAMAR